MAGVSPSSSGSWLRVSVVVGIVTSRAGAKPRSTQFVPRGFPIVHSAVISISQLIPIMSARWLESNISMSDEQPVYKSVLVLGPPGSGKGTQGKVLSQIPGFVHVSSGDLFRNLDPQSELGQIFLEYSTRGELVPDDLTVRLWRHHMDQLARSGQFNIDKEVLFLDGIPRSAQQAEMLADDVDMLLLLHLQADEETMVKRIHKRALQQNRLDDANPDVVRRRFQEYEAATAPVLEYYPTSKIRTVDAAAAPLEVLRQIIEVLQVMLFPETLQHAA